MEKIDILKTQVMDSFQNISFFFIDKYFLNSENYLFLKFSKKRKSVRKYKCELKSGLGQKAVKGRGGYFRDKKERDKKHSSYKCLHILNFLFRLDIPM